MKTYFSSTPTVVTSNRILYTASPFARSSLLHLQEIGELEAKRSHTSKRSDLQSYLFFTVLSGTGTLTYNEKTYSLTAGDCVFIDCHNPYSHTTDPDNLWTLRWIHFYGSTMSSVYNKYCERGGRPVFTPNSTERFTDTHKKLMTIAASADYMRDMLINQYLSEFLVLLMEQSWHPEDQKHGKKRESLYDLKEWIDQHYAEKITLEGLSSQFFINKYYLSKTFKEQFGQSLSSYIQSVRITKAKQMLRFSDKTVEEIGYECGLGAPHYFSQRFKEVEGMPPSKYREQW